MGPVRMYREGLMKNPSCDACGMNAWILPKSADPSQSLSRPKEDKVDKKPAKKERQPAPWMERGSKR